MTADIEYPLTEEQRATYIDKKSGKRVSAYRFRVYDALLKVPAGKVTSYKLLADSIGSSPRAVGQALRHNPFAPYIPCHRVVTANGFIGGFSGQYGRGEKINKKKLLLKEEGVEFADDYLKGEVVAVVVTAEKDEC